MSAFNIIVQFCTDPLAISSLSPHEHIGALLARGPLAVTGVLHLTNNRARMALEKNYSGIAVIDSYLCTYDLYGPQVMHLMHAEPLRGQVGGGWALYFFGLCEIASSR